MIHFLPDFDAAEPAPTTPIQPRGESLARALAVVEEMAGEPASGAAFSLGGDASERAVAACVAGLEALQALTEAGASPNPAAARLLAATMREALGEMGAVLSL